MSLGSLAPCFTYVPCLVIKSIFSSNAFSLGKDSCFALRWAFCPPRVQYSTTHSKVQQVLPLPQAEMDEAARARIAASANRRASMAASMSCRVVSRPTLHRIAVLADKKKRGIDKPFSRPLLTSALQCTPNFSYQRLLARQTPAISSKV